MNGIVQVERTDVSPRGSRAPEVTEGPLAETTPQQPLCLNDRVRFFEFDSDAGEPRVLCEVPTADDGDDTRRYALPASLVSFLRRFDGQTSTADAVAAHRGTRSGVASADRLEDLVEQFLVPRGILVDPRESGRIAAATGSKRPSYLYVRIPLLSARRVFPLASRMGWLFSRVSLCAWIPLFLATQVAFLVALANGAQLNVNHIVVANMPGMIVLALLGTFVHELGHASAAVYYGCQRIEIGFGIYLFYGVFYADVSEAWRLPRRQRVVVDLGGLYFQSFFMAFLIGMYFRGGQEIYLFAFFFLELAIMKNLNPFLRMDGYWVMSDLFGIANLRRESLALLSTASTRLTGIPKQPSRPSTTLSKTAVRALGAYLVLGTFFFVALTWFLVGHFVLELFRGYGDWLYRFLVSLDGPGTSASTIAQAGIEVLWRTVALIGLSFFLFRLGLSAAQKAGTWLTRRSAGSSRRREDRTVDSKARIACHRER